MITAAASPRKIFFFPPDSAGVLAPPNVNDGADPTMGNDSASTISAFFNPASASATCAGGASTMRALSDSRAGAGALAAPLLDVDDKPACKAILGFGSVQTTGGGRRVGGGGR